MNPLVSVIIPVYNSENSIKRCINSILKQDYNNYEIIIIDDGSEDGTAEKIKEFNDKRIKLIKQSNSGVSISRNKGIENASGDYITFVDSDDFINESFIKQSVEYALNYNLDIVIGGVQKVYKNRKSNYVIDSKKIMIYEKKDLIELKKKTIGYNCNYKEIKNVFFSGPVCKLFKKNVLKDAKFVSNIIIGEDTLFNLDVINFCNKIGIANEIWYYYIINSFSATQRFNKNIEHESIKFLEELRKRIDINTVESYYSRVIRQIDGIMMMYPFNQASGFNNKDLIKYLKLFRNNPFWKNTFKEIAINKIPTFRYKIVSFLFKYKLFIFIIIYYKLLIKKRIKEVN